MQEDDFCTGEQFATRFTSESIHCISILSSEICYLTSYYQTDALNCDGKSEPVL